MKWFKHYTDNHRGQSIQTLMDECGHLGLGYYVLLEMCAEKLEKLTDRGLTEADCSFSFHRRVVQQSLRTSPAKLKHLLDTCATLGLLRFALTETIIKINIPMLLDLLDRDTKKARSRRVSDAAKCRLDKDIDKDKDKEEDKESSKGVEKTQNNQRKELNKKVWESYREAYKLRYHVEPLRNATTNTQISQLASRLGAEAIDVVKFYLKHPDSFYISKTHSIGLCLKDCETLRTQMLKGKAITKATIRQIEKRQTGSELMQAIERGEV